jgi:predicted ATP-dependent endonuclease of OLD family
MSDGERAIFYMIGQALVADESTVLIVDEPELHVHRSIMSKLWDELEAIRPDCAFVFITHDLEFAAVRPAQKFVIREYDPAPRWTIEDVPTATGFDEELTTMILGSRRPILFVEGDHNSLDMAIYRCCYPEWTVIPRASCTEVSILL